MKTEKKNRKELIVCYEIWLILTGRGAPLTAFSHGLVYLGSSISSCYCLFSVLKRIIDRIHAKIDGAIVKLSRH